jgi:hypothetical protein
MERYSFLFASDEREFPAHEGLDLPDIEAAVTHAKLAIGTAFRGKTDIYDWSGWRVSIRDETGREVAAVPITETLVSLGR